MRTLTITMEFEETRLLQEDLTSLVPSIISQIEQGNEWGAFWTLDNN